MGKSKIEEKNKELIKKSNIRGKIKKVEYFKINNKKYAIVINKVTQLYAIRLIDYEDEDEIMIKAVKRFPNLMEFYSTKEKAFEEAEKIKGNQELIDKCIYEIETQEDDVENNIFLIGRTGNGKSTMANVLINKNDSFEEVFKESARGISKTKDFQTKEFEFEGTKYRVVDTIGVGDTKLSYDDVLYKLGEAIHSMKRGIMQVFLVIGGRFTKEEMEVFDLLLKIFEKDITNYITIIRTKFEDFQILEECNKDIEELKKENKKISQFIDSCNGIIHVNNPSLSGSSISRMKINKDDRENSRKMLLEHLIRLNSSTRQKNYKLEKWDVICIRVNDFVNAKKLKEERLKEERLKEEKLLDNLTIERNIKKEIKELKKEVVEEIRNQNKNIENKEKEFQVKLDSAFLGKLEFLAKIRGDCCSIT